MRAGGIPDSPHALLKISNVDVVYNRAVVALRGVGLQVPEGKIVALLGPNGAGKSTLLRAVSGLLELHSGRITRGEIYFDGRPIHREGPEQIVALGITQVLEGRRIFSDFTVEENLRIGAHTRTGRTDDDLSHIYELFPVLKDRRKRTAGFLSGGEQQMLAMGRALMSRPRCLLLDEPSLGLAPALVEEVRELIVTINRQGTTILLVEQNAAMALSIADTGYVLETGRIALSKSAAEMRDDEDVRRLYLGEMPRDSGAVQSGSEQLFHASWFE